MKEIAVLMAAGLGTRMRPLTDKTAKPLIKIHGKPMIETVIDGLQSRGVMQIYVVVGYKKEQFYYLENKYSNLTLVDNADYMEKNNAFSLYAACDAMEKEQANCFICESDLFILDQSIFDAALNRSCYYGRFVPGHSEDWIFELDDKGRITRVGIGGDDTYNMVGIAYFLRDDVRLLIKLVRDVCRQPGNGSLFWDDIVDDNLDKLDLTVHSVDKGQLVEIDTLEEFEAIENTRDIGNDI